MVLILSFLRNQIHDSLPSIFNRLFLSACCLLHLLQNLILEFSLLMPMRAHSSSLAGCVLSEPVRKSTKALRISAQ